MKLAKKLASLTLALVMILALSVPALASGGDTPAATGMEGELTGGSITINDAMPGETYKAYQVLYLESYDADKGVYSYKANSAWEDCLKTNAAEYLAFDEQGYVTWKSNDGETQSDIDARAAAFAALLKTQLTGKTPAATQEAPAAAESAEYSTVTMGNLKLGYYLVDTTTGALCSLDTTNPTVEMEEKNEKPTIEKKVQEDSKVSASDEEDTSWGKVNDADIGQSVNFKTTVTAQAGATNYVVHDKMSTGLTFEGVTDITLNGTTVDEGAYEVKTSELGDDCTFHVVFKQAFCDTLKAQDKIVISYSATVNGGAVVAGDGNPNETKLSYGEKSETQWDKTVTYTWKMDVLKYGGGNEGTPLADAQFVLLNNDKSKVATIEDGKVTGWENVPTAGEDGKINWDAKYVLKTGDDGKIAMEGLDADTYYLEEIKAPDGYNKLTGPVKIEIKTTAGTVAEGQPAPLTHTVNYYSHTGKADAEYNAESVSTGTVKVNNNSGTELPSTGGIGTTIFYAVGGVLVLAAVILLVAKKRMAR